MQFVGAVQYNVTTEWVSHFVTSGSSLWQSLKQHWGNWLRSSLLYSDATYTENLIATFYDYQERGLVTSAVELALHQSQMNQAPILVGGGSVINWAYPV